MTTPIASGIAGLRTSRAATRPHRPSLPVPADPGDRGAHRVLGIRPLAHVLPHPEHQEQPVVGACAEDQHDQQQLGDDRDLQAGVRRLADQRPGDGHGEERGY
jgi:hypothetical protein